MSFKSDNKIIFALAIPAVLQTLVRSSFSLIDAYWVGKMGSIELAALSISYFIVWGTYALGEMISTGTNSLVAQSVGAEDKPLSKKISTLNIVNNFISGLILLAERPVRTGDLIQLGDLFGTVEHIGARSTRITTAANLEIIVPNSTFLENNVVNWTLANNMIRTSICVGVVYGSPTRMVTRLLKRAADEHGLILDNPEPFVWFTDFGDNSLNFELHFYIQIRNMMERRRVESDIRYKINELLNEAGITIAFPQRDVHLDTAQPLKVQVTPADRGEAEPPDDSGEAA